MLLASDEICFSPPPALSLPTRPAARVHAAAQRSPISVKGIATGICQAKFFFFALARVPPQPAEVMVRHTFVEHYVAPVRLQRVLPRLQKKNVSAPSRHTFVEHNVAHAGRQYVLPRPHFFQRKLLP